MARKNIHRCKETRACKGCNKCRYEDLITSMSLKTAFKKGYVDKKGNGEVIKQ